MGVIAYKLQVSRWLSTLSTEDATKAEKGLVVAETVHRYLSFSLVQLCAKQG
jgi:hypothetical protein